MGGFTSANVIQTQAGHEEIMQIVGSGSWGYVYNTFSSAQTSGSIEMWVYNTGVAGLYLNIAGSLSNVIYVCFGSTGQLTYLNRSLDWPTAGTYLLNTWTHICLQFDLVTDTFDLYCNGTKLLDDVLTAYAGDTMTYCSFEQTVVGSNYVDAVDYSWAIGYAGQRNMAENNTEWTINTNPSRYFAMTGYTVVPSLAGHANALRITKIGVQNGSMAYNSFITTQSAGTIEWWFYPNYQQYIYFSLLSGDGVLSYVQVTSSLSVSIVNPGWTYTQCGKISNLTWHHFRAEYDLTGAVDTTTLYVDGIRRASQAVNLNSGSTANRFGIITDKTSLYDFCVDSIDYSWSSGYVTNRNWRTLPDPDPSVDQGEVGVYNATFSFEEEPSFGMPDGWKNSSGTGCTAYVSPGIPTTDYTHRNVFVFEDDSVSSSAVAYYLFASITIGCVEMWVYYSDVVADTYIQVGGAGGTGPDIIAASSNLYDYTGSSVLLQAIYPNCWYHLRIAFDCTIYKCSVYVNGILRGTNLAFYQNTAEISSVTLVTSGGSSGYFVAIDGFDTSSD